MIPLLAIYTQEKEFQKKLKIPLKDHTQMFIVELFIIAKKKKSQQPNYPSIDEKEPVTKAIYHMIPFV